MAIFESTIFENLSGTVGNVTSYKLKDKQVARAKNFSRKDAKTLQQLKQRTRMKTCLLYTSPSPRDVEESRMPSSA